MIGKKIREKRQELNMSLKDLEEKTNLTRGFISQVERDIAEPSISSLRKIAEALNVPIFYFLMDNQSHDPVVRKNTRRVLNVQDSDLSLEMLCPELNRNIQMVIGRLKPGSSDCDEPLVHLGEEIILVMEGKMQITLGDSDYTLEEGDSVYCHDHLPHKIWNVGELDLVYVSAIANVSLLP
ncbi:MAG: MerR family transcriptional regulator [Desulfitibacter sp. BRH_c19]|nr:MAG: MerR family transcriptional regulator [Desulfitibacter sp. BRH_c19]